MLEALRDGRFWLSLVALLAVTGCQTGPLITPTRRPTATPVTTTAAPPGVTPTPGAEGPTPAPGVLENAVPCVEDARQQTVVVSNADRPPPGVGGDEEEPVDEGRDQPPPDNQAAVELPAPVLATLRQTSPGGVGGDELVPVEFGQVSRPIITRGSTAEPSVASDGTNVLLTWNRHAGVSTDGGRTFRWIDPRIFVSDDDFCCDQRALYIPGRQLWVWIMQTGWPPGRPNKVRVAVAHGAQPFGETIDFTYWEWTPQAGRFFAPDAWVDQPKVGNSEQHLFVTANVYDVKWEGYGGLAIRIPLDQLLAGTSVTAACFGSATQLTPVSVASDTMYFAGHKDTATLLLWRWPDAVAAPDRFSVDDVVGDMSVRYGTANFTCARQAQVGDQLVDLPGTDWCLEGGDYRIASAWLSQGRIGLAWSAAPLQLFDRDNKRQYPYVYVAFVDEATLSVVGHWTVKAGDGAVQYPVFGPNARGDIGGVMLYGGGPFPADTPGDQTDDHKGYPACVSAIYDPATDESAFWVATEHESTLDPRPGVGRQNPRIGDYLGVWVNPLTDMTWSAGCMTYTENGTEVEFFRFGRRADVPG